MAAETKNYRVKKELMQKIRQGGYAVGERFPSGRQLASDLGISYVTANNVLRELEVEGYLHRIPGIGTFVSSSRPPKQDAETKRIGYLVDVKVSIFARFFSSVLNHIPTDMNCLNVPLRMLPGISSITPQEHAHWIDEVFQKHWDSLTVYGDRHFPFRELARHEHEAGQINFVYYDDTELPFEHANRILADNEKVGYLAGTHFLKKGVGKLAVLSVRHLEEIYRRRLGGTINHHGVQILNGLERAYQEMDQDFYGQVIMLPYMLTKADDICELIHRGYRHFFVMGDAFTGEIYKAADRMNLKIGRDLEILGMFNLDMDGLLQPTLSSISLNDARIGKYLSEAVINDWHGKTIAIEPKIIYRESSGK